MSYATCEGCKHSYKAGTGLSNHQRGCGMLIAKLAAQSAAISRLQEQKRTIEAQATLIAEQQRQIEKLASRPITVINNTMNINIVATEKVAKAITTRFEQFNVAMMQWIEHRRGQNAPLIASALVSDLQAAPDRSFLETFNLICGKEDEELEVDVDADELAAADEEAIEKHQDACVEGSRKILRLIKDV